MSFKKIFSPSLMLFICVFTFSLGHAWQIESAPQINSKEMLAQNFEDDFLDKLNALLEASEPRLFNGMMNISVNGQIVFEKSKGFENMLTKTAFDNNSRFRIQSNSKQITAVLVLKEVEKGNLVLSSPISEYLDELSQDWADEVTLHQLLNMTSGITNIDEPTKFKPGTTYFYSNPGYGLIGEILENVTGKSYIELVDELFTSLNMTDSGSYVFRANNDVMPGYSLENGQFTKVDIESLGMSSDFWKRFIPTGGLISTMPDMVRWDWLLHNGHILSDESYQKMISPGPAATHQAFGDRDMVYNYGLRTVSFDGLKSLGHAGRGLGFASIKFYIPKYNLGIVVMENVYHKKPELIYYYQREIYSLVMSSLLAKNEEASFTR